MIENDGELSGHTVSRRSFLKAAGLGAGATALAFGTQPVLRTLAAEYKSGQSVGSADQVFKCACMAGCTYCQYDVLVHDGHVVKADPKEGTELRPSKMCLRGRTHLRKIYDPDRLKYPMKRAGARGENKWERISWEEAITAITDQWKADQKEYGNQAVALWNASGTLGLLNGLLGMNYRMSNVLGFTKVEISMDDASPLGATRVFGGSGSYDYPATEMSDVINSKAYWSWGANITEAAIQDWSILASAMEAGTKLVVIDPNYTTLASKADLWVHPRPATDAALVLSMIQVIVSEGLHDRAFLLNHTVAPILVRQDTKKFLRMSDLGVAPTQGPLDALGQPTVVDPTVVWDLATGGPVSTDAAKDPAMEGTRTVNGIAVRTAFDLLMEEANKYTPEAASEITDVDPDTIRTLARMATDGPIRHYPGFGAQSFDNGVHPIHALATLIALTGNFGVPGASFGSPTQLGCFNYAFMFPSGQFAPQVSSLLLPDVIQSGEYMGQPHPVKDMYVATTNPLCGATDSKRMTSAWDKLDQVVVADAQFTDTARYADIVLPVTEWLETMDVSHMGIFPIIAISEKAVEPLFEAKSDTEIVRLLTKKMGVGEWFEKSDADLIDEGLNTEIAKQAGVSYASLIEKKEIRYLAASHIPYADLKFKTGTGRIEFYVEDPKPRIDYGQEIDRDRERLPHFFPPTEAWPDNEIAKKYPLVLMSERPRTRIHCQAFGNPWLLELVPEPIIKINTVDAAARGIVNGDYVECYNDRGHAVAKAVVTGGVRPGVMVYPKGWQRHQFKAGAWSEMLSSAFDPVAVNMSFFDNAAEVRAWNEEV